MAKAGKFAQSQKTKAQHCVELSNRVRNKEMAIN